MASLIIALLCLSVLSRKMNGSGTEKSDLATCSYANFFVVEGMI